MGDLEHQHHKLTVLDVTDHPVVAHAVSPEPCEVGGQNLATSSFLSCLLAVSEIRSVQAKLLQNGVEVVGLLPA